MQNQNKILALVRTRMAHTLIYYIQANDWKTYTGQFTEIRFMKILENALMSKMSKWKGEIVVH